MASLLLGGPGLRKSAETKQYAEGIAIEMKRAFVEWNTISFEEKRKLLVDPEYRKSIYIFADVRLGGYDPTDLKGLPNFHGDVDSVVEWRPQMMFYILAQPEAAGCLFLDEITQAPMSIQAPAYQLILDRCVGDIKLSDDVFLTAAGNRPEDKTDAFPLGMALRNRFMHMTVEPPTIEDWTRWALDNGINTDVVAYLNFQPSHMVDDLQKVYKQGDNAYATPRSWVAVGNLLDTWKEMTGKKVPFEIITELAKSAVGEGHARTFRGFVELLRDVDMDKIIKDPTILKGYMEDQKMDQTWAVIGAVPDWYAKKKDKKAREDILNVVSYLEVDFAVAMIRMTIQRFPELKREFLSCTNKRVIQSLVKYL